MNLLPTIACVLLWVITAGVIFLFCWRVRIVETAANDDAAPSDAPASTRLVLVWAVLSFIGVPTLLTWALLPAHIPLPMRLSVVPALLLTVIAVAYVVVRRRTRLVRMLLGSSDPLAALIAIRDEIEMKGRTPERLHALGLALGAAQRWPEAVSAFQEAQQLGMSGALVLGNRALATWKSGRPEEAAVLFAEARKAAPDEIVVAMNHCQLLAELRRWDAAYRELQAVEALFRETKAATRKGRPIIQRELERCRALFSATVHQQE